MTRRVAIMLLFATCIGCDGRLYRLSIHQDAVAKPSSDIQADVVDLVVRTASEVGFKASSTSDYDQRYHGRVYAALGIGGQGYAATGWCRVLVEADTDERATLHVTVLAFPAFDYPVAKSVRVALNKQLVQLYGDKAVEPFK